MTVKAIRLSDKTDPNLLEFVESFESSIHDWKFREEEGSEGEEFDGEGWNLKFWRNREGREQKRREERVRQRAMEKIGKIGAMSGSNKPEVGRGRSPDRYSYSRSSESRSRSPPSRRRDRSYSRSPPRRKRPQSRSRSPSPKWKWSPPPRDRRRINHFHLLVHQHSLNIHLVYPRRILSKCTLNNISNPHSQLVQDIIVRVLFLLKTLLRAGIKEDIILLPLHHNHNHGNGHRHRAVRHLKVIPGILLGVVRIDVGVIIKIEIGR